MDTIEQIGAFLGLAAFLGLGVLVLLYFQQARDVRRLREWAGRAPERAEAAADEATAAAAREAGIAPAEDEEMEEAPRPEGSLRERLAARIPAPGHIRERLPEPVYLVAGAAVVALIAVVAVTGAFGLIGGDAEKGGRKDKPVKPSRVDVAVLNGTAASGSVGTPGLAETVSRDVKSAGYDVGVVGDAGSFANTFAMYRPGHEEEARAVAADLDKQLEILKVDEMTPEVKAAAGGAQVAVVIGLDNSQL